jgi:hypothetical protein
MKIKLLYITILLTSFCYSQNDIDKEKALLKITKTKNTIVADTIFNNYISQGVFKNKKEYKDYATQKFNEYYSKKDTVNALYIFNILGLNWAKTSKLDSVLRIKPIAPLLTTTIPIDLRATTKSVLSHCLF